MIMILWECGSHAHYGRGFTTGLVAAAYGLGTFFTGFPIDSMIKARAMP